MEESYRKPQLRRPFRQRIRLVMRVMFGFAVMMVASLVLLWLFGREEGVHFCGIVEAGAENVGPAESVRIVSVDVVPGQSVKAGDVLVHFDPTARLIEAAMNEVKIRESEQSAMRFRAQLQQEERRCRQLVREASVALEERRMEHLHEEAELAGLDAELARLEPLVEKKFVSVLELTALRPKADALRRTVKGYEPLLNALRARFEQAQEDLREIGRQLAEADAVPVETNATLRAALKRYEMLQDADPSVLRAISDGVVSQVFRRAGDIVPGGEAVVRVAAAPDARMVTGMLPSGMVDAVHVGDLLTVSRAVSHGLGAAATSIAGCVETIDPEVLDFFDPMNSAPRTPARGRKVRIRLVGDAKDFIPGETVLIADTNKKGMFETAASFFRSRKDGAL